MAPVTDRQAALIAWAKNEIATVFMGDMKAFAESIGYDSTVIGRVFSGHYGADPEGLLHAIERSRKKKELKQTEMIPTDITARRLEAFDYADGTNTLLIHYGPNRTGKTITGEYWCRLNKHAIYVLVPTQTTPWSFTMMLCEAAGIKTDDVPYPKLQQQLFAKLSKKRNVLYVDEAGYLLKTKRGGISMGAIGVIKDIVDICKCAVILTMQSAHFTEMPRGKNCHAYAQLLGRAGFILGEPERPMKTEVMQILRRFVSEPSIDFSRLAIDSANDPERMSALLLDLKRASWNALQENREITAKDLREAQAWRRSGTKWKTEE